MIKTCAYVQSYGTTLQFELLQALHMGAAGFGVGDMGHVPLGYNPNMVGIRIRRSLPFTVRLPLTTS